MKQFNPESLFTFIMLPADASQCGPCMMETSAFIHYLGSLGFPVPD
jgi:hypothetical protein